MRIEQLEYIAAVARLGSYRKAAEALHISQPALSESVRGLERELGVDLLERSRQGARLSGSGRDLLQHMLTVLDAVDRLRHAADHQHHTSRVVRIGTVNTATVPLLAPAIRQFRETHPGTQVEVVGGLHADIQRGLLEGSTDLGLVNCLEGDDMPPELETTPLLLGHAVVCLRPDSPLADQPQVTVDDLRSAALIGMRSGYVMHRYLHRLLGDEQPVFSYSADGAEMGKLMVAEGLGITVLPDFSVIGDPLERRHVITWRPLAEDRTKVHLVIQRPRSGSPPRAVRDLHRIFMQRARIVGPSLSAWPGSTEPVAKLPASGRVPGRLVSRIQHWPILCGWRAAPALRVIWLPCRSVARRTRTLAAMRRLQSNQAGLPRDCDAQADRSALWQSDGSANADAMRGPLRSGCEPC